MKLLLILALIIDITGYGEIPAEGMDITVTDATVSPMTGQPLMSLDGSVETTQPLTVTITRSQAGISDEFCCANQCTAGNMQTTETRSFNPGGKATWFIHYTPAPDSDVRITYLFSDGNDARELRVRYLYEAQGMEKITDHQSPITRKIIRDGQVLILSNNKTYRIL